MDVRLSDGYSIKGDTLNYELTNGKVSYFFRSIDGAVDRFLEIKRRDKLQNFSGTAEKALKAIKECNKETLEKILKALEGVK